MKDLIDRLSKLIGPDREIDGDIMQAADPDLWSKAYMLSQEPCGCSKELATEGAKLRAPLYTASLDAAIALAERVLPGHRWSAGFSRHVPHNAQIWVPSGSGYYEGESDANRAIALCIAILRAKDASHGE